MGWQDDPIVGEASNQQPWLNDPVVEEDGLIERLGSDLESRHTKAMEAQNAGQQTGIETTLQNAISAGNFLVGDVPSELLKSGWNYLDESVKSPIRETAQNAISTVANTRIGDNPTVGQIVSGAGEAYGQFKENNPRAGRNTDALLGAGNLALAFTPIKGKSAVGATVDAATDVAKAGAKVAGSAAGKFGKAIIPGVDEGLLDVATLAKKHKIPLSLDQVSNSRVLKNAQKLSQEVPFSGQGAFRDKQMLSLNRALFKTVGVDADRFTPKNMDLAFNKVGGEFDNLTKGKTFSLGDDFTNNIASLADEIQSTGGNEARDVFQKEALKIIDDISPDGTINGEMLGRKRAALNALARKSKKPELKEALLDLEGVLVDVITSGDDGAASALSQAKHRYKNLLILESVANKAKGGNISPSLLNSRVEKIFGRSYTRGNAGDIGELARVGYELLPELGGSDTTQKLLTAAAIGGGISNPASAAVTVPISAANRLFQSGINRNQSLIDSALMKEIAKLPPKEAEETLKRLRAQ